LFHYSPPPADERSELSSRSDLGDDRVKEYAQRKKLPVLMEIPFDPMFIKAMLQAQTVIEYSNGSKVNQKIKAIWNRLFREL
jgi:MinD superfamily P-loop ATPase